MIPALCTVALLITVAVIPRKPPVMSLPICVFDDGRSKFGPHGETCRYWEKKWKVAKHAA